MTKNIYTYTTDRGETRYAVAEQQGWNRYARPLSRQMRKNTGADYEFGPIEQFGSYTLSQARKIARRIFGEAIE